MSGHNPRPEARAGPNAIYMGDLELAMLYAAANVALTDREWRRGTALSLTAKDAGPYPFIRAGENVAFKLERVHNAMVERRRAAVKA